MLETLAVGIAIYQEVFFFFFKQKTAYEIMPSLVGSEMCIRDRYMGQSKIKIKHKSLKLRRHSLMQSRLETIASHLARNPTAGPAPRSPDDVVICAAVRTPLTKSKRGPLKDTPTEVLLATVFKGIIDRTKLDPKYVNDMCIGNVLAPGAAATNARMGQFLAGFPDTVPVNTTDRLCSSGLEAVATIASKIKAGLIDVGIAGGVENMSLYDMQGMVDVNILSDLVFDNEKARNCLLSMGQTSENVAEKYGISREKQDSLAVLSHQKAAKAQELGLFDSEIVPVKTTVKDDKGQAKEVVVSKDDGIRKDTTVAGLAKLKPAFKKDGSTTAGNASQVSDGAAAVLLARRSHAQKLGLPILARFITYQVAGVPPEVMGIGPAYAIPLALEKAGLKTSDIDIYEINEAFASQATYSIEKLGIDLNKVNPKGGAIALGHPLGCTGSRQMATILPELKRTNGRYGVLSMCIGTGMGAAAVIERENQGAKTRLIVLPCV
eukprot:TRINITY_DN3449_c0_g1_i1.p1 TRINITY_DN3449_c0_g1~~TRINITY_DN3449_c0_g1_i1.p1  ORF type:complete len:492 (-),score=199.86 TRINITY_DN3449_c0_g1_i1:357-1832(-)